MSINLTINGTKQSLDVEPDTPLLWVIRDDLDLTGTKFGCGVASCGACTVHINGEPTRSCVTAIEDVEGADVVTIEGVEGKVADSVKEAWNELDVVQCGYCQSGQIMSAIGLLTEEPKPTDQNIDDYMSGNACRCATYHRIRAAIHLAADKMEG